jgi:DNA-binding transcriptional LysR family regulator
VAQDQLKTHPSARQPKEVRYYDSPSLSVEAASTGLGVALSPLVLAVDDVERGSLAAPAGLSGLAGPQQPVVDYLIGRRMKRIGHMR